MQKSNSYILSALALAAVLVAGALYADKVYVAPQPPPEMIWTIKGQVLLHPDAEPGDLITAPNLGTIYYLNNEKKRITFPDEQTFLSWYDNYDAVKTISRDVLESYSLAGRNATIRPGTYLITIQSSPQVWMIGHPNVLYWLTEGESQVAAMFGEGWADRLVDLPEYYFDNYFTGADISTLDTYPAGTLLRIRSNEQLYIVTLTGQRLLIGESFFNLFFHFSQGTFAQLFCNILSRLKKNVNFFFYQFFNKRS